MADEPPNNPVQTAPKKQVYYALLDQLVETHPDLTDAQILQLYHQQIDQPHSTVTLISEDLNEATKVILASALPDQQAPQNTHSQAQYKIDHKIDSGGQSHVYLAHRDDGTYQKQVVIKVLNQSIEGNTQKQQMMAEMQILADLKHPNIVAILDAGIDDEKRPWLMLDFVPGVHIDQFMRQHKLNPNQIITLFKSLAKALAYIHQNQVVHADIKPANILVAMVNQQPNAVIIDFGIASTDDSGGPDSPYVFATPAFASPEQLNQQSAQLDHRSDIFSLGKVMQYLLQIHSQQHQSTKWINQDFLAIINHCVADEPAERYPDMQALIDDLARFQKGDVVSVIEVGLGQLLRRKAKQYKWQTAVILTTIGLTGFLLHHSLDQSSQNQALLQGASSSQNYWQKADQISNQSRLIYALPKRNIEPDFKALNQQFDQLAEALAAEPVSTQKLAFESVADAGVSLGRFSAAQNLLLKAHASNPDDPDIKFKLGKNHLLLYQNEMQSLQNYALPDQRRVHSERLHQKYFEPAFDLFNGLPAAAKDDPLIISLMHYFNGEHELALIQLNQSDSQLLWPIERLLLAAQITREQANQILINSSQANKAKPLLNEAISILSEAKMIARSHPEVHKQLCQTTSQLMQLTINQKPSQIGSCDDLLTILPNTAEAKLVVAEAYAHLAQSAIDAGQPPLQLLQQSRSILKHPWNDESDQLVGQSEQIKGHLLTTEGKWQLYSNQDFTNHFKQAINHHQRAVQRQPNSYASQLDLAAAWYNLANYGRYKVHLSDHHFEQATQLLKKLLAHADATPFLPGFLVRVLTDHAYIRYQVGLPADHQLDQANQLVQQYTNQSTDSPYALLATATLYWTYCDYLALQGKNPEPFLTKAIDAFDRVILNEPAKWTNRYNQISAMLSGVTYYLEQNTLQTKQLGAIKTKLEELQQWIAESINLDSHWGYYYNMMAINDVLLSQSPQNSLKNAWQHNAECVKSPIDGYVCIAQMATSLVTEVKWNLKYPAASIELHQNFLAEIEAHVDKHPEHHQLLARYGHYLWLKSQFNHRSKVTKINHVLKAHDYLKSATEGNPLLAKKYSNELAAIKSMID